MRVFYHPFFLAKSFLFKYTDLIKYNIDNIRQYYLQRYENVIRTKVSRTNVTVKVINLKSCSNNYTFEVWLKSEQWQPRYTITLKWWQAVTLTGRHLWAVKEKLMQWISLFKLHSWEPPGTKLLLSLMWWIWMIIVTLAWPFRQSWGSLMG